MSTIVGTNIEVTNIKFDSDTTSMIISNAGQVTVQGEGTNTTNLQQGLAKSFVNATGNGASINTSFNVASIVDNATGDVKFNFTNNMSSTEYSLTVAQQYNTAQGTGAFFDNPITGTTSLYRVQHYENGSAADAYKYSGAAVHGDLA